LGVRGGDAQQEHSRFCPVVLPASRERDVVAERWARRGRREEKKEEEILEDVEATV
jgi:hypothetical protein